MSERFKSLRVVDPRIARESQVVDIIAEGPAAVVYNTVTAPDPTSLSPIFTIQPGSVLMGVNRTMRLRVVGTITVGGSGLNVLTSGTSSVCLRQFPLHSIMQNIQVTINNSTNSLGAVNLYVPALAAVANTSASMGSTGSTYPSIPDTYTNYDMAASAAGGEFDDLGRGPYGDAVVSGRTAQITSCGASSDGKSLVVGFDISEDLIMSPFSYSEREQKYIYGVQTMVISCSYTSPQRLLCIASHNGAATLDGTATLALTKQQLEVAYVTPDDSSLIERPIKHVYDYAQVQYNATSYGGPVAAGATFSMTTNALEFPIIPSKLVIMCTYSQTDIQDGTQNLCDVSFPIVDKSCTVQFGTRGGLFSGASSVQLWDVSRRGGSHDKYPIWAGKPVILSQTAYSPSAVFAGRPLIIDVAADLSLPAGGQPVTPGMNVRTQFSFTATFTNHTGATVNNPRLIVLSFTPGYLEIRDGASSLELGGVTLEAARKAPVAPLLQADVLSTLRQTEGISGGGTRTGGGFFDDLWDGIKSIPGKVIDTATTLAPHLLPLALGAGAPRGGASIGGASIGGAAIGGRARARLFGGRPMGGAQY